MGEGRRERGEIINDCYSPTPTYSPYFLDRTYRFTRTTALREINLPFVVPNGAIAAFRASIYYDFVMHDLALLLLRGDDELEQSVLRYNREDIESISLDPGNYYLRIYEPANSTDFAKCVPFVLQLGLQVSNHVKHYNYLLPSCILKYGKGKTRSLFDFVSF